MLKNAKNQQGKLVQKSTLVDTLASAIEEKVNVCPASTRSALKQTRKHSRASMQMNIVQFVMLNLYPLPLAL